MVIAGLVVILLLVLVLPFVNYKIEENLEIFLFVMGVAASVISGLMSVELVLHAMKDPIKITLAVLIAGTLFYLFSRQFQVLMNKILSRVPLSIFVFCMIVLLGLLSSIITAIIAAIILVEIIYLLPLERKDKIVVCIFACFSIGMGAALTPIGEPLATIAVSKLDVGFFYLFDLLAAYIIPGVVVLGVLGSLYVYRVKQKNTIELESAETVEEQEFIVEQETWRGIMVRAAKVYLFVMALVFLGEGFQPLIDKYLLGLSPQLLYWINIISAVLDNATLTAAEISQQMTATQVKCIIMGLLISGGMLIPGNIPNIISASKLKIGSKEWALWGLPVGLVIMIVYFVILFLL